MQESSFEIMSTVLDVSAKKVIMKEMTNAMIYLHMN